MALPLLAILTLATTDLTFVRHAETVANATGRYNARTLNALSDKGRQQVAALTRILVAQPPFDEILVSPSPRAMMTIAPYLQSTHRKATVWPLLYECCTGKRNATKPTTFKWDGAVSVPKDLAPYFVVRSGDRLPVSPDWGAGLAQVQETVAAFRANLAGKRVLLVGHSGHGGQFLHALTGKWIRVENAKPIHCRF